MAESNSELFQAAGEGRKSRVMACLDQRQGTYQSSVFPFEDGGLIPCFSDSYIIIIETGSNPGKVFDGK